MNLQLTLTLKEVIAHLVDIVKVIELRYIKHLYLIIFDYSKAYDNLCKNYLTGYRNDL